jgi:tRNA A37 threonylcarbamoyladenosine dehydratase
MNTQNDLAWLSRTALLVGDEALRSLAQKHVLIVGMGGVGSFAAEFICRSGIGHLTIVDGDVVDISNCNRQLPAMHTTVGQLKVDIMKERLLSINPNIQVTTINEFLTPTRMEELLKDGNFDYAVDCIDSVSPKLMMIETAMKYNIPLMSSMGAGGRVDVTQIKISDISKSYNCPLAFYVRKRLKRVNIRKGFKVVFSSEPVNPDSLMLTEGTQYKRSAYGTMSWIPAAFGGACASVVIRDLLGIEIL